MEKIKPGQTWQQRNKKLTTIDEILENNGITPVRSGSEYWMANGRYWDNSFEHPKDLLKLIQ